MNAAAQPSLPPGFLTPHFALAELTLSQDAARRQLDNTPTAAALASLRRLAAVLEQVRALLGNKPVVISSGYRAPAVNAAVKGARNSAHMQGLAADFTVPGFGSPLKVCQVLRASSLPFDQLIFEGTWVHLGLAADGAPVRGDVLTAVFNPGRDTTYVRGLGVSAA